MRSGRAGSAARTGTDGRRRRGIASAEVDKPDATLGGHRPLREAVGPEHPGFVASLPEDCVFPAHELASSGRGGPASLCLMEGAVGKWFGRLVRL